MSYASSNPIILLVFNRLDTVKLVLGAIQEVRPSRLYIASDGPRSNIPGESERVQVVRDYITSNINWPCKIKTLFRKNNLGCKLAVSSALDWFFESEEQGIILEDDCLPDISFFKFCDELLEKYKYDKNIALISGDNFNTDRIGNADYYFSKLPHIWGWASWRRTWNKYDIGMSQFFNFKKEGKIKRIWTDKGVQNYWLDIFDKTYNDKIDTWDYQLAFSVFFNNNLCICPNVNLVSNIGFRKDSSHTIGTNNKVANLALGKINFPLIHPEQLQYDESNDLSIHRVHLKYYKLKKYLRHLGILGLIEKIYIKIKQRFKS